MELTRDVMNRLHQTGVSAALRKLPMASHAAEGWWFHTQSKYFKNVCSGMGLPAASADLGPKSMVAEVPSLADAVAKLPDFVTSGERFSQEMAQWCNTSKFLSYTMRKDSCGYQDIYAQILKNLRGRAMRILEIGIGVNDPTVKSGMAFSHRTGASLSGWCGYFPGAEVHGADVDRRCLVDSDKYRTHFADQLDADSLQSLAKELGGEFDLVVDDGLHTPEANANVIAAFLPLLKPHGILVVEDILAEFDALWFAAPAYLPKGYRLDYFPSAVLRQFRGFRGRVGMAVITRG